MKILIIGSGGREHAIAHKLSLSPRNPELYAAPGNAGIAEVATCVNIQVDDLEGLLDFAVKAKIELTIVGPELPLVMGVVDLFESHGLKIFGPKKAGALFEGSKDFTKAFLLRHGIPTAKYETHTKLDAAIAALKGFDYPVVIKADGLAAGKGVVIAENQRVAEQALIDMMTNHVFGDAGDCVVIEAFLKGVEASVLCFVDGKTILPLQPAQDYKKAFDGDEGLNTGGMGTYSPSMIIDEGLMSRIQHEILDPFITGIQQDGIPFKGILFIGLMIDGDDINVLEYNARLGDPETEVTLIRMENDLLEVVEATLEERLSEITLQWRPEHAVCVIMASGGYPEAYEKGFLIEGLPVFSLSEHDLGPFYYHCGTKKVLDGLATNGGRVLGVTALGEDLREARRRAYDAVKSVSFEKMMFRKDIGTLIQK